MAAYLFVHFIGEEPDGEQVYFAVSRDGLHWSDLNGGKPVLVCRIGTQGVRDPFVVQHPVTGRYYLMATDLRIASGCSWQQAKEDASRDMIIWESDDLIHWDGPRAVSLAPDGTGCLWAPEAIYDEERGQFFVFFSCYVNAAGKLKIYGCFTEDFRTFSEPFVYMERSRSVIDAALIRKAGRVYRVSKNEEEKRLELEASDSLYEGFSRISSPVLDSLFGLEGPELYPLLDGRLCLIADQFIARKGYLPMIEEEIASGDFRVLDPEEYDFGKTRKRHGGVIEIPDEAYHALIRRFG